MDFMTPSVSVSVGLPGRITVERDGDDAVLRMVGEIDLTVVEAYEAGEPWAEGAVITAVDLSEVTYLSSCGIGLLLRLTRQVRNHGDVPTVRGLSRPADRILRLAGLAALFGASI